MRCVCCYVVFSYFFFNCELWSCSFVTIKITYLCHISTSKKPIPTNLGTPRLISIMYTYIHRYHIICAIFFKYYLCVFFSTFFKSYDKHVCVCVYFFLLWNFNKSRRYLICLYLFIYFFYDDTEYF